MLDESACDSQHNPMKAPLPLEASPPPPCGWRAECGAKTRGGAPCRRPPLAGRTRCRLHGGASPAGIAHPRFKDGSRAKDFPRQLRQFVRDAENDPDLISLRRNVEMLEARRRELLKKLCEASERSVPAWAQVSDALASLKRAWGKGEGVGEAVAALDSAVCDGAAAKRAYEGTWKALLELNAEEVKTKAAEWKRMADLRLMLPAEQALMLVEAVMRAIFDIYGRDDRLAQLTQRVRALVPPALRPPPRAVEDEP